MDHEIVKVTNNSLVSAIKSLTKLFYPYNNWAITGSANLAIRGIKIQPSDVDIITTHETADKFALSVHDNIPSISLKFVQSTSDTIKSYYANIILGEVSIDVMADAFILTHHGQWQALDNWYESIEYIQTELGQIPLTSLKFERNVYSLLNCRERVKIIDSYLR